MSGYSVFAKYYDELTQNISYKDRADFFAELIKRKNVGGKRLLDLACGTGSLSFELARLGFDVIGADGSEDMLAFAAQKNYSCAENERVFFINQSMEELELPYKADIIVCALDSVNHITDIQSLEKAFKRAFNNLSDDGIFIFDVNSEYKHYNLLSDKIYVYDCENVYCVWQNSVSKDNIIKISLDFFENSGDVYRRSFEEFSERFYAQEELEKALFAAGLKITDVYGDDRFESPTQTTQRLIYTAEKSAK